MENHVGKTCPFCKGTILENDPVVVCPACGIPHHENCWVENHGCTTFGCSQQNQAPQQPQESCTRCGAPLAPGQGFCTNCGAPRPAPAPQPAPQAAPSQICPQCGNLLQPGQHFCPRCGYQSGAAVTPAAGDPIGQFNANVDAQNKKKKLLPIIIGVAAAVVALIIVLVIVMNSGPDFNKMFPGYADKYWCDISNDGTYMRVDTNPYDLDDELEFEAWYAIEAINEELELPSYVFEDMGETRSIDGMQSYTGQGYYITWTYHPDEGLEVTYRVD